MFGFGFGRDQQGFFDQALGAPGRFDHQYQVFPVCFIGKEDLEKGNKIILPQSALDHLARLNISYPMLFETQNPNTARKTHCGVQEFIAEEGTCYLPYWMMSNLLLSEGDIIRVTNTSLPKGKYVKLQPVSSEFLNIHNPRAVLENTLRNFATLTVGDCIVISYNQNKYEIEIVECKPANAISIIEADVNVDFAEPKFNKDPPPQAVAAPSQALVTKEEEEEEAAPEGEVSKLFTGQGQRVDGKAIKTPLSSPTMGPAAAPVIDELAHMPWKKRIPGGVKWKKPPFGYNQGHMTGEKLSSAPVREAEELFLGDGHSLM